MQDAARRELEDAGRLDTPLGRAAMVLAERIDRDDDTAAALASLAGAFRNTITAALAGASRAPDHIDEVKAARQRRLRKRGLPDD